MKNTFRKIANLVVPAVLMGLPMLAAAQVGTIPRPGVPGGVGGTPITLREIEDLIGDIARFLITIAIVVAVIAIVWGGLMMITGGESKRYDQGKAIVKRGIFGALIVLAVGVILQTLAAVVARTFFNI